MTEVRRSLNPGKIVTKSRELLIPVDAFGRIMVRVSRRSERFFMSKFVSSKYCQPVCLALAALAFTAAFMTLSDPGISVDETIYVRQGAYLFETLRAKPAEFRDEEKFLEIWGTMHEHPPLGRLLLGAVHDAMGGFDKQDTIQPQLARPLSALAFASTVYFCGLIGWRVSGAIGGIFSAVSLSLMPRFFGHAHFASLEMISVATSLGAFAAVTPALHRIENREGGWVSLLGSGVLLGLALLTKMTAVVIIGGVVIGAVWSLRARAILPIILWLVVGVLVFVAGWPWLWPLNIEGYSPGLAGSWERLREYLSTSVHRATIFVWYLGEQRSQSTNGVPWHYVWVTTAVTVPAVQLVASLLLGLPRLFIRSKADMQSSAIVATWAVTMLLFSLPIERYDGERLFLISFPFLAIASGAGCAALCDGLSKVRIPRAVSFVGVALAFVWPGRELTEIHPFELSYYNNVIGGLSGAERAGFEPTYWGDSCTHELLRSFSDKAPFGTKAYLIPTLHPDHPRWILSSEMKRKGQQIVAGDRFESERGTWAIVFNRKSYLADPLSERIMAKGKVEAEVTRQGVWLARVYTLDPAGN